MPFWKQLTSGGWAGRGVRGVRGWGGGRRGGERQADLFIDAFSQLPVQLFGKLGVHHVYCHDKAYSYRSIGMPFWKQLTSGGWAGWGSEDVGGGGGGG